MSAIKNKLGDLPMPLPWSRSLQNLPTTLPQNLIDLKTPDSLCLNSLEKFVKTCL